MFGDSKSNDWYEYTDLVFSYDGRDSLELEEKEEGKCEGTMGFMVVS